MNERDMTDTEPIPVDVPATAAADPLAAELEQARRQIADYKVLVADFDNSRKRLIQDAERQRKYAHEPLAHDILAAIDNLDRAVDAAARAGEQGSLVEGVKATNSLMLDILKRHGVQRMDAAPGGEFDPNRHQAVSQAPATDAAPAGTIAQVLQHGFMLHDRVLRPASVVVAVE